MYEAILVAFGTLFPIVNPISTAFVFNSLTVKDTIKHRRHLAWLAALTAAGTLLVFLVLGQAILSFFGITIYAFRVAGGIYLGKVAFEMLAPKLRREPADYQTNKLEIAFIPLAIPLLAGPGAMTATIALSEAATLVNLFSVAIAIALVAVVSWLILRHADVFGRVLGPIGTNVVERVLGLIVLVIAAQFIFNGITGYLVTIGVALPL